MIKKEMVDIKWIVSSCIYFIGIGLWFIVAFTLLGWGLVLMVPTAGIAWIIGYMSSSMMRKTTKWPWFRELWIWEFIRTSYFGYTVHGPGASLMNHEMGINQDVAGVGPRGPLPCNVGPDDKLMWAIYPHGVFPWTAIFHWALNPRFKNTVPCMHGLVLNIPIIRELAGWAGSTSVSAKDMKAALENTGRIVMCPEGIAGMANKGREVKKRYGFLRLAKEANTQVVPIWIPEERSYYRMWMPLGRRLEPWARYPIPLFVWGLLFFPLLPRRIKTRIYVGEPVVFTASKSVEDAYTEFYLKISDLQEQADKETVRE